MGGLVPLGVIGTPSAVGSSPNRGTGNYRVPSLRGVGDRSPLFASGSLPNLEALLNPARATPGHRFGLALSDADRSALLDFLKAL